MSPAGTLRLGRMAHLVRVLCLVCSVCPCVSAAVEWITSTPTPRAGTALLEPMNGARIETIDPHGYAGSSVNVVANVRQTLFTHGELQFAGYYDSDGYMVLARRRVGTDAWERRRTEHRGNVADAHNSISLAVDGAGFLHVSWDHHGNPLNYATSLVAAGLELGPRRGMTGRRETQVTYPQFFRTAGGDLFFLYRDGASGRGALVLNRFSLANREWTQVVPNLIDGEGQRSPYWGMAVGRDETLHLGWIWRESPDVATNHDLCYARSADGGKTWTTSTGLTLTLPITARTAEYAARIPQGSNLMNPVAVETDAAGAPYLMSYWSPEPGAAPRFHIVHPGNDGWKTVPVEHPTTYFSLAGAGTKRPPISRGVLLLQQSATGVSGTVVYRDDSRGGNVLAATGDPRRGGPWAQVELTSGGVGAWEPSYDPVAWREHGRLEMLLQRVQQRDGRDDDGQAGPPQPIAVLSWKPPGN